MEFSKSPVSVCAYNRQLKTKTNLEADVIVPDTRPDISRVLNVKALPDVSECYIRKDKIVFSGKTKFTILYVGEDDMTKIFSIDYFLPFNHQSDFQGIDEDAAARCVCNISSTSFDVKNSRKLLVGAVLDLCVNVQRQSDIEAINGTDETFELPCKCTEHTFDCLIASEIFEIDLSDTLTLPTTDDGCEIYDVSVRPDVSDIKTVNNKAIIKGNAGISVLYMADEEIMTYETESPFTEIVDINAMQAEQTVISHFEVADVSYVSFLSDSGLRLDYDFKLRGNLTAYESRSCTLSTDIYSPDYSYDATSKKVNLMHIEKCNSIESTIKDTISVSNSDSQISKIYYMDALVSTTSVTKEVNSIVVKGSIENNVIYSEDSCLNRVKHSTPFEIQIPCQTKSQNVIADAYVSCVSHSFSLASGKEIQTRNVITASAKITSMEETTVITDFKLDETLPIQKNSQPSIIVVYPTKGTDIWTLAKKYNTTSEEIIKINSLDSTASVLGDKPLLIPKRQSK